MMNDSLVHALATASPHSLDPSHFTDHDLPQTLDDAYRVQLALLSARGEQVAGWKVGGQGKEGNPISAAIGNHHLFDVKAAAAQDFHPGAGLELELYFTLGREFKGEDIHLSDEEILSSIASFGMSIEWVQSRFKGWPNVNKLLQLSDVQNNGALLVGPSYPYDPAYDFMSPHPSFTLEGESILKGAGVNPAGDPRALLPWVVRHCCHYQIKLDSKTIITTGSYSGIHFPESGGTLQASFSGLPSIELHLL
jgi:2-keto-4-pentenoate hydratase